MVVQDGDRTSCPLFQPVLITIMYGLAFSVMPGFLGLPWDTLSAIWTGDQYMAAFAKCQATFSLAFLQLLARLLTVEPDTNRSWCRSVQYKHYITVKVKTWSIIAVFISLSAVQIYGLSWKFFVNCKKSCWVSYKHCFVCRSLTENVKTK